MWTRRMLATGVISVTAVLALAANLPADASEAPSSDEPAAAAPAGWNLAWSDEFTGSSGTSPNDANWVFDTGGEPQWGNQEWQYYTDRPENVSLDGAGNLAITARKEQLPGMAGCPYGSCDITSGRITSKGKFAQAYGRLEASIKVPKGQGMWPAFWMMGANIDEVNWPECGEIDIMETVGKTPNQVEGTAHATGFPEAGIGGATTVSAPLADAFHTFAVEWKPASVTWFVDTTAYFTISKSELASGQQWPFDQPFYLLLNLAVGGEMPGSPDASTPFPSTMLVNYVRAYTQA